MICTQHVRRMQARCWLHKQSAHCISPRLNYIGPSAVRKAFICANRRRSAALVDHGIVSTSYLVSHGNDFSPAYPATCR